MPSPTPGGAAAILRTILPRRPVSGPLRGSSLQSELEVFELVDEDEFGLSGDAGLLHDVSQIVRIQEGFSVLGAVPLESDDDIVGVVRFPVQGATFGSGGSAAGPVLVEDGLLGRVVPNLVNHDEMGHVFSPR